MPIEFEMLVVMLIRRTGKVVHEAIDYLLIGNDRIAILLQGNQFIHHSAQRFQILDPMAVAFHAYGLYCMWSGFQAYRQLAVLERQLMDPQHPMGEFNPHQTMPTDVT